MWSYANSLKFNQNQNSNVTGLNYNWGDWRPVNDIFWDTTFPVARTLSASTAGGIDFKVRIENRSSFTQTVTMPLSGGKDGAGGIQLNPVDGSLILSGTIFNDNSVDYAVFGSQTATVTNLTLNTALGPNAPTQTNVDFVVAGGRNTAVQVNASQVWAGTTDVQSGSFTTANGVTLASTAIVVGGGTVATTSANTLADTASLTVNTGRLSIGGSDTVASLAGSGGTVDLAAGATLTVGGANTSTTFAGGFVGAGSLVKVGAGTLTLSGSSGVTGPVDVSAGIVRVSGNGVVGGSPAGLGSGTVSIASGAQVTYWLDTSAGNTIANPFALSGGTLHTEDGGNIFNGRIALAGGTSSITGRFNDFVTVSGGLSGTGSVIFGQQGDSGGANAPTFLLSGTGTMTGTVRVTGSAGSTATKLFLNSVNALQSATLDMAAGDTGTVDFGNGSREIGGLMGSRDISPSIAFLTVGGNGASTEYSGRITMNAPYRFTKTGTGTLLLSGSNGSLAGEVRVTGGRLEIGPTGSINAASAVSVSSGAEFKYNSATPFTTTLTVGQGILSGTGTIATQVLMSSTATVLSPGNSPGVLTFGTSQSWSAYTYVWELNDYTTGTTAGVNFDQVAITGSLNLAGNTYVLDITSLTAGNLPGNVGNFSDVQRSWTILTTTGGITGFDAAEWTLLTNDFTTSAPLTGPWSLAQVGNDLVLTAVPEPATLASAVVGIAVAAWSVRRRRAVGRAG